MIDDFEVMEHEETKPKQDSRKFDKLADDFIDKLGEREQWPLYHHGKFYLYQDNRYIEEPELPDMVRRFLKDRGKGQSNNVIGNVVPIIQNRAHRGLTQYKEMPFYFGKAPFPKPENIIAYRNGLLDVERYLSGTVELLPHVPQWASTVCLPYDFDTDAQCPLWEKFLEEVFEGDKDKASLLQEFFGYCLMHDGRYQSFLWMKGPRGSGKSTALGILCRLLGDENYTGFSLHRLAKTHGLAQLEGKLVAVCGESDLAGCEGKYQILETFKRITGGDPVEIDQKFEKPYSVVLPTRFVISSNEQFNFVDPTGALSRRALPLCFDRSFEKVKDTELPDKLATEIAGISVWALLGYARLRKQGRFTEPESSKRLRNENRRYGSHVFAFLQDCCMVHPSADPGCIDPVLVSESATFITDADLRTAFEEWCQENAIEPSMRAFGKNLGDLLPKVAMNKDRRRINGKRCWCYPGLSLKPPEQPATEPATATDKPDVNTATATDKPDASKDVVYPKEEWDWLLKQGLVPPSR